MKLKISQKAIEWLASGERGCSSNSMFTHLTGVNAVTSSYKSHPYDPDDFRRCCLLLEEVPELKAELHRMAEVSPEWAKLVAHWEEIKQLIDEEVPGWLSRRPPRGSKATKGYYLIKKCVGR